MFQIAGTIKVISPDMRFTVLQVWEKLVFEKGKRKIIIMDNSDLLLETLGYMADMHEEGCELKFNDDSVREIFEEYLRSGIHDVKNRVRYLNAVSGSDITEVTLRYTDTSSEPSAVSRMTCRTDALLRSARLTMQQAEFIIRNPQMFAGCEVEV